MNAANPGDTILVDSGTYNESVNCTKPVTVYTAAGNFVCTSATIQQGVNSCPEGGTVYVPSGTYTEAVYIDRWMN